MGNKSSQNTEDSSRVIPIDSNDNNNNSNNRSSSPAVTRRTISGENSSNRSSGRSPNTQSRKSSSYYHMIKNGYQELVNAIIRPPRCKYELSQLGPNSFEFCDRYFIRQDLELRNKRGYIIQCSHWLPIESSRPNNVLPCVIYMHGNSSSRLEALSQLSLVLHFGATLFAFDFAGSGKSEGEYVSLGAFEKDDLQVVIEYLRNTGTTSTIALWGRSMGAATALLHGERDPSIAGMVLDSAFADLEMLAEELVDRGRQHGLYAPGFVVSIAIRFIRSSVLKTAGFDIKELSPIAHADKCFIPALFVAAENDTFVAPHHSRQIFEKYAGDKNLIIVDGDHNSHRPRFMQDSAAIFLETTLQIPSEWVLENGRRYIGSLPWSTSVRRVSKPQLLSSTSIEPGDLSIEDILAITKSGSNSRLNSHDESEMQFGMTTARQNEIQSNIYTMLGSKQQSNRNINLIDNHDDNGYYNDDNIENSTSDDFIGKSALDILNCDSNVEDIVRSNDIWSNNMEDNESYINSEWICTTCTLINEPITDVCLACGVSRY
mmetsp:Transcript_11879/g.10753  ORF Transcript_11879/g.10753 Transcript_11879/m.10753 type:complete len:545 (+) Transcript_11879:35-1669(+)